MAHCYPFNASKTCSKLSPIVELRTNPANLARFKKKTGRIWFVRKIQMEFRLDFKSGAVKMRVWGAPDVPATFSCKCGKSFLFMLKCTTPNDTKCFFFHSSNYCTVYPFSVVYSSNYDQFWFHMTFDLHKNNTVASIHQQFLHCTCE